MKIYENLAEIADRFDAFLVDAYGVFWNGSHLISGAADALSKQVSKGKPVCVLSNTSMIKYSYDHIGLKQNVHYTDVITSGDVFYDFLKSNNLPFPGHKIYIFGITEINICKDTSFHIVPSLDEADIVYFGIPQLTEEGVKRYPEFEKHFFKSKNNYNSTVVDPFLPGIKEIYDKSLPVVSTNPDLIANHKGQWVIRQGTLSELFRKMGGRIVEYGKPYSNIFDYAFKKLNLKPSSRIAMIGDTYRTDIKGALNTGITPVWCLDTGIAQYEIEHGHSLLEQADGSLEGITLIHHL